MLSSSQTVRGVACQRQLWRCFSHNPPQDERSQLATIVQSGMLRCHPHLGANRPAPSMFFYPGLQTQPVWSSAAHASLSQIRDKLVSSKDDILAEYLALESNKSDYEDQEHSKLHTGSWDWHSYILKGERSSSFAQSCPKTCEVLETLAPNDQPLSLMKGTPFSFTFFSTMGAQSKIQPHYGPTNLRLRVHFPLILPAAAAAPDGLLPAVGMEVGGKVVTWRAGEPVFFDDSYAHHVWNETQEKRVLLLFDLWHPDLSGAEVAAIQDMFNYAKEQGWLKA